MADGYVTKDYLLHGKAQACPESATTVVSSEFRIGQKASLAFLAYVTLDDVTKTTGITVQLQTSPAEGVWIDAGDAVDVTNDVGVIRLSAYDPDTTEYTPLWPKGRIVCKTGADDECVVTGVIVANRH